MSLLSILLRNEIPPIHHSAQPYRSEEYRDKPKLAAGKKPSNPYPAPRKNSLRDNTKRDNLERVFAAIAAGNQTLQTIIVASKLSRSTVFKTTDSLAIDRLITIKRSNRGNTYLVSERKEK